MRSETTKVVGLVGAVLVAACGSDDRPDARIDQPEIDAASVVPDAALPDAGTVTPDAAPPKPAFSGTISIQEVDVQGLPQLGQGMQVTISFTDNATAIAPVFEEMPGSLLGCKVWEYTAEQAADVGLDEGTVTITPGDADGPAFPPCTFVPTRGYMCIGESDTGGTIALVDAVNGLWSLTDADATFTAADIGRTLNIMGATSPVNNGNFPIVGNPAPTTIVFASAVAQTPEPLPAGAVWTVIAGTGPNPAGNSPALPEGFLENADSLTVELTAPAGGGDIVSFQRMFGDVADDFTLSTASQMTITNIPTDGSAFTIGCTGEGGTCGAATGSILTITTTDGSVAGLPPYAMPAPVDTEISIRCATIGGMELTVPAAVSAYIMNSGATRIQTTFLRSVLQSATNPDDAPTEASTNLVAGHGTVGFTTP